MKGTFISVGITIFAITVLNSLGFNLTIPQVICIGLGSGLFGVGINLKRDKF